MIIESPNEIYAGLAHTNPPPSDPFHFDFDFDSPTNITMDKFHLWEEAQVQIDNQGNGDMDLLMAQLSGFDGTGIPHEQMQNINAAQIPNYSSLFLSSSTPFVASTSMPNLQSPLGFFEGVDQTSHRQVRRTSNAAATGGIGMQTISEIPNMTVAASPTILKRIRTHSLPQKQIQEPRKAIFTIEPLL